MNRVTAGGDRRRVLRGERGGAGEAGEERHGEDAGEASESRGKGNGNL